MNHLFFVPSFAKSSSLAEYIVKFCSGARVTRCRNSRCPVQEPEQVRVVGQAVRVVAGQGQLAVCGVGVTGSVPSQCYHWWTAMNFLFLFLAEDAFYPLRLLQHNKFPLLPLPGNNQAPRLPNATRVCCLFAPARLRSPASVTNLFLRVQNPFQHICAQPRYGMGMESCFKNKPKQLGLSQAVYDWVHPTEHSDAPAQLWFPHGRQKHGCVVPGTAVEKLHHRSSWLSYHKAISKYKIYLVYLQQMMASRSHYRAAVDAVG